MCATTLHPKCDFDLLQVGPLLTFHVHPKPLLLTKTGDLRGMINYSRGECLCVGAHELIVILILSLPFAGLPASALFPVWETANIVFVGAVATSLYGPQKSKDSLYVISFHAV